MRKKTRRLSALIILLIGLLIWYSEGRPSFSSFTGITGKVTATMKEGVGKAAQAFIPADSGPTPIVIFCPQDHCMENLLYLINRSDKIHCAVYDLNLKPVIEALKRKDAQVVIDGENRDDANAFARHDDANDGLMHNKFCIFDDRTVLTGSFNPTARDNEKNNNNVLILFSPALAENYEQEFQELWEGKFRKGEKVPNPKVSVNGTLIENYFCPEDDCEDHVIDAIKAANQSVHFMTFSFTSDAIGNALKDRHWDSVEVKGVFEKSQNNDYTELPKLQELGMDVRWDHNKYNVHHKVFIIDRKIVVTGSYNPTKNGNEGNDENVLIIHSPEIAERFEEEFKRVFGT